MPLTHKTCEYCSKDYTTYQDKRSHYCSRKCANNARKIGGDYKCTFCGNMFHRNPASINNNTGKRGLFCSHLCANTFSRGIPWIKPENMKDTIEIEGYVFAREPSRKDLGIVERVEHRVVCCKVLGINKFDRGWHVHHRDCNTTNNSPENLAVLTTSDHRKLHMAFGNLILTAFMNDEIPMSQMVKWAADPEKMEFLISQCVLDQGEYLNGLIVDKVLVSPPTKSICEGGFILSHPIIEIPSKESCKQLHRNRYPSFQMTSRREGLKK